MEISPWVLVEMLPSQLHKAQGKVHFIIPQTGALVVCYCHYPRVLKSCVLFIGKWKFWLSVLFVFRRAVLQSCMCLCLCLSRKLLCEGFWWLLMTPNKLLSLCACHLHSLRRKDMRKTYEMSSSLIQTLMASAFALFGLFLGNVYHYYLAFGFKAVSQCQFCING